MRRLIWDIQVEHLDEAEFLLETWVGAIDSPRACLEQLRVGPERRLIARLDGLAVGGVIVVDRLLLPELGRGGDAHRMGAIALALVRGAGLEACAQVLTTLDTAEAAPEVRRGLILGLGLAQRAGLVQWLGRDLDTLRGASLAARLEVLARHRVDAGARVVGWLEDDALEVRRAAAVLARHTSAEPVRTALLASLHADDHQLRGAAIESALIRGLPGAWAFAWAEAQRADSPAGLRRVALAWLARLGDETTHQRLLAALRARPSAALLWAIGHGGRLAGVDLAIELLDHPQLARLAGEVVSAIAGLPTTDARAWLDRGATIGARAEDGLPALADDDLAGDLVPTGDAALPLPDPKAVREWWASRRAGLDPRLRHLGGRPLDRDQLVHALQIGQPTRRRHGLALELAARTGGAAQISTIALVDVQRAQLDAALRQLQQTTSDSLDLQTGLTPVS